jgi:hypothetical protein
MTETTTSPRKFFRKRPDQVDPFYGPVMARTVVEDWGAAWCVTPYNGPVDEARKYEYLNKAQYVEVYYSPTTQHWEEV